MRWPPSVDDILGFSNRRKTPNKNRRIGKCEVGREDVVEWMSKGEEEGRIYLSFTNHTKK